jgi:hypothetical protein
MSLGYPQRDFALRHILQMVYAGLGQEVPTFDAFDDTIFARIYEMLEQYRILRLTYQQAATFWEPMIAEVQRMHGDVDQTAGPPREVIDVDEDVDMEGNGGGSDWELGSGVGSEEGEGEGGTDVAQSEDGTEVEQDRDRVGTAQGREEIDGVQHEA